MDTEIKDEVNETPIESNPNETTEQTAESTE